MKHLHLANRLIKAPYKGKDSCRSEESDTRKPFMKEHYGTKRERGR